MTPEERAAALVERARVDPPWFARYLADEMAAAIHEAVSAETETCAALVEDRTERFFFERSPAAIRQIIAATIRQRAASRAQPAP